MFKNEYEIASYIDHTFLKANATKEDLKRICNEARKYRAKAVSVNPCWVKFCKNELKDTDVHVGGTIGFPFGQNKIETKCFELKEAIKDGVDEIDYVLNVSYVKENRFDLIRKEMEDIVSICKENNVISKVIFETGYLTKEEIIKISKIASEVKPNFIKTSTGIGVSGATFEDVKLMIENGGDVSVKASGGIRTLSDFSEYIRIGAKRIGTSSMMKIIEEFKKQV